MSSTRIPKHMDQDGAGKGGSSETKRPRRDLAIDTLRGLAIILMVAGHVLGSAADEGMRVADDSVWRTSYLLFADLRIPLFTALSGFVYGLRPLREAQQLRNFVRGKAKRLILPLLTVGTLYFVIQNLAPGTNHRSETADWWRVYAYGYQHFWFLQAILILLLGIGITNALGGLTTQRATLIVLAVTVVITIFVRIPYPYNVFSVNGAIRLAPFFLLGYGFSRFWRTLSEPRVWLLGATVVLFTVRAVQVLSRFDLPPHLDAALGLGLGLAGISTLIIYRERLSWRPLAWLGYFSFSIYLMHVFGTAPTRILLHAVGVTSDVPVFILCLLAGLAFPVIFEMTLGRIRWISWAFLGQKPYTGMPAAATPR